MVRTVLKVQVKHFMEKDQKAFSSVFLLIGDINNIGTPVFNVDIRQRNSRKNREIEKYKEAAESFLCGPSVINDSA